jgi:CPA2 family monovalent cation:H+ antiporter-2
MLPIWHWTLLGALVILSSKLLIVTALVLRIGVDIQVAWRTGLLLSVGGDFGLALVAVALDANVIYQELGQILIASVLLSMIAGAFLIRYNSVIAPWLARAPRDETPTEPQVLDIPEHQVVIGGYGRVGHTIAVLLHSSGVPFIAFDNDPNRVAQGRADGFQVFYGDISDPGLLSAIHIERASLIILSIDQFNTSLGTITWLRHKCPSVPIIARARDLETSSQLLAAGATHAYPEAIEASLRLGATALEILRVSSDDIEAVIQDVRDWGYRPVVEEGKDK